MLDDNSKLIQARYLQLPPEIQDLITADRTRKFILELGKRNGVHVDELGILENEILIVMLGLEDPARLPAQLRARAHFSEEKASAIAAEVDKQLLAPLRSAYERLYHLDRRRAAGEKDPTLAGPSDHDLANTGIGELKTQLPASVFSSKRPHGATTPTAPEREKGPGVEHTRLAGEARAKSSERTVEEIREKLPARTTVQNDVGDIPESTHSPEPASHPPAADTSQEEETEAAHPKQPTPSAEPQAVPSSGEQTPTPSPDSQHAPEQQPSSRYAQDPYREPIT